VKEWESNRKDANPLNPEYRVRDTIVEGDFLKMKKTGLNNRYGDIDRNFPCALPPSMPGVRNL